MKRGWLWLALLLWLPLAQAGQAPVPKLEQRLTPEQMRATGLDQLSPDQLALLNRLLAETAPTAIATEAGPAAHRDPAREESLIGFNDEPIRSRIGGTVSGWEPGTVFVLANGQQWKVLKGRMQLSRPLQDPDVRVVPGVAGRWFLEVHEDAPKARVYRID